MPMTVDEINAKIVPQPHRGFSHFGWSTPDREKTEDFFVNVLGFSVVKRVGVNLADGGTMDADFYDVGGGQLIEIGQLRGFEEIADDFDAGLNDHFGIPDAVYHIAFDAGSPGGLQRRRQTLIEHGVQVTEIIDEGWRSLFFFKDPTNITLAFECAGDDLESIAAGVPQKVQLETGLRASDGGVAQS